MQFNKNSIIGLSVLGVLAILIVVGSGSLGNLGGAGRYQSAAAILPTLASVDTFSVLAQTAITSVPASSISGDVGMNDFSSNITGLMGAEVAGTIYATDAVPVAPGEAVLDPSVQADAASEFNVGIPGQGSDGLIGPALDGLTVTPGVYDIGAGRLNGGVLHLDGPGVYIFRASSDFISSGSIDLQNGARACDVFWRVETLATINGNSFIGTIIAGTGVHFGANVTLDGRALAVGGDVTLISDTISGPSCSPAQIIVNKTVVNDNDGSKVISDFPLFIDATPLTSGFVADTTVGLHTISETSDSGYTSVVGGDCAADGTVTIPSNGLSICTITNNDVIPPNSSGSRRTVPPLIDVVKVPNPLALPLGPGLVTYTYTLHNVGTVPVTDVTMVGDTCSPIKLISGDINNDSILDLSETWVYTCATTLTQTHTNIITATGWANGISASDIASATVVVGGPVPPLIHVTKIPSPLALFSGGGMVTYTNKVTNPGTVPLSNVSLEDDKCDPVKYISGDSNGDSELGTTETWTFTCNKNLSQTTTNTVTAQGTANGITATDFAIATVVVSVPSLPKTGFPPESSRNKIIPIGIFSVLMLVYIIRQQQAAK